MIQFLGMSKLNKITLTKLTKTNQNIQLTPQQGNLKDTLEK